jgi:hypothetical protein
MKKTALLVGLVAVGWYAFAWFRGSTEPRLSDEQRRVVEARVKSFTSTTVRTALFLPPLAGDAAESYERALDLGKATLESLPVYAFDSCLEDLGDSWPATLDSKLRDSKLRGAADAIVEGARRAKVTVKPSIDIDLIGRFNLGRATLLVAIDEYRRGDLRSAVELALAVQRYANDLAGHSLLAGALFTNLSRDGARVLRAIVETERLGEADLRRVGAAIGRLRADEASPVRALQGESYLVDVLLLEDPAGDEAFSGSGRMWDEQLDEYGGDSLRGYVEINGRLQDAWMRAGTKTRCSATSADAAIGACESILGEQERFCESIEEMFLSRAETEIYLRDAQIAVLTQAGRL